MRLAETIIQQLNRKGQTLAVAESCTGGLITDQLTNVSGSSPCLLLGIVAYSNDAKHKLLKVPRTLLKKHGAVSEQVALAMAQGVRVIQEADYAISVTGIAGPSGGTPPKPVGRVYVAVVTPEEHLCLECQFEGTRKQIKMQTMKQALRLLEEFLF